ncbi:hypothetical protein [[Leptolyngbya] sp. PCC 7376]|uniref:hypothetical protein n=1 Tax=[Leptolyngbya] sp. PCC 7376 TaxID=111781 RepID=UPI0002D2F8AD|nr:hypothetical protein [[Leptolyngbya] sp. PCC 7376]
MVSSSLILENNQGHLGNFLRLLIIRPLAKKMSGLVSQVSIPDESSFSFDKLCVKRY